MILSYTAFDMVRSATSRAVLSSSVSIMIPCAFASRTSHESPSLGSGVLVSGFRTAPVTWPYTLLRLRRATTRTSTFENWQGHLIVGRSHFWYFPWWLSG